MFFTCHWQRRIQGGQRGPWPPQKTEAVRPPKKREKKKKKKKKKGGKRETKQNPTTLRPLLVQLSLAYTFSFC